MAAPVSNDSDLLIRVDGNDRDLGTIAKRDAHLGAGTLHRAFSVFLFNSRGETLLQRRALGKMLWGGYWSNSVCSHPRVGEEILDAAVRRVLQELNVAATDIKSIYAFVYRVPFKDIGSEYEYCYVFTGRLEQDPKPHPDEIMEWRWIKPAELIDWVKREPHLFTPWFKQELEELRKRDLLK